MTLSEQPDEPCEHTKDRFDNWEDTYEMEPPVIRLIRICTECGGREEYVLEPETASQDFMQDFDKWQKKEESGDIDYVGLRLDEQNTDGFNAYAGIVIERDEKSGLEFVGNGPYYFYN